MTSFDNILFYFSKQLQPRCAGYAIITYPQRERAEHKQKQRATSNEREAGAGALCRISFVTKLPGHTHFPGGISSVCQSRATFSFI